MYDILFKVFTVYKKECIIRSECEARPRKGVVLYVGSGV